MKKLSVRKARKIFNSTANKTKAVNTRPRIQRGGIRA